MESSRGAPSSSLSLQTRARSTCLKPKAHRYTSSHCGFLVGTPSPVSTAGQETSHGSALLRVPEQQWSLKNPRDSRAPRAVGCAGGQLLNPAELQEISSALKPGNGFYFHFLTYSGTAQAILISASFCPLLHFI